MLTLLVPPTGRCFLLAALVVTSGCTTARNTVAPNPAMLGQPAPNSLYPTPDTTIRFHSHWTKTHYPERIAAFKKTPLQLHDIVFLGNSLTEQGGDWGQRLGAGIVKNRGIAGDVTAGVLQRLDEICYYQPKAVFLLIGINDLFNDQSTPEYVAHNIRAIVSTLRQASPQTRIYVQTILPTTTEKLVPKIQQTNDLLKSGAGKDYFLIDTHQLFADDHDLMKKELTHDGVHLTEAGYQLWAAHLKRYLN